MSDRKQVEEALRALADVSGGSLTPEAVVESARSPESPMHGLFTWDDAVAGQKWRLEQARELIRSVKVVISTEARAISTVHYVRDPSQAAGAQGYVSVTALRRDPEGARAAVLAEFSRAASALARARGLADALGLAEQVDTLMESVEELRITAETPAVTA